MLPTSRTARSPSATPSLGGNSFPRLGGGGMKTLLRRVSRLPQMDFELAIWQLCYLCIAPRRVYRNVYYHRQTKNTWARDDPAMLLLITLCLVVSALLWSLLSAPSPSVSFTLRTILSFVLLHFFATGLVISTALWALSNKFLTHATHMHATDQKVEWPYAFDIHANAFFPFFLQLYVAQLVLAPVVTRSNWISLWVGNTLYLAAFVQYIYVS
ncbi:hypothetical protein JCM6882_007270, partial [Rhodosporidiobolus microsporus]